jgi:hypothetical protein
MFQHYYILLLVTANYPYYREIAGKSGLNFIFDGNVPEIPFYAVPYLCIIGRDEKGAFLP